MKVPQPGETGTHRDEFVVYCNDEVCVCDDDPSKQPPHFERFLCADEHDAFTGLNVTYFAHNLADLDSTTTRRPQC